MKKTILFDFDGVILDSFASAYEVSSSIHPRLTETEYKEAFEGNINDSHSHTHKCGPDCKKEIDFFTEYTPKVKVQARPFNEMPEIIKNLSEKYHLCIISSTVSPIIRELLSKFDLEKYFSDILGNDIHTSKVEKTNQILNKYQLSPDDCVFITDTLGDIKEAKKAGVKSIAVSWGFHTVETLNKGNPIVIVNSPKELEERVNLFFIN